MPPSARFTRPPWYLWVPVLLVAGILTLALSGAIPSASSADSSSPITFAQGDRVKLVSGGELGTVNSTPDSTHVVVAFDGPGADVRSFGPGDLTTATTPPPPPPPPDPTPPPTPTPTTSCLGLADAPPSADSRPYSIASPFNQEIPPNPTVVPQSDAIVKAALANGVGTLSFGQITSKQFGHPVYIARDTDPQVTVHVGGYSLTGMKIRLPALAKAAGGGDGHIGVVQPDCWEIDLWHVTARSATDITAEIGYRQRYDGPGVVTPGMAKTDKTLGGTTASYVGLDAGTIGPEELIAGHINHALFLVLSCGSSDTSFGFGVQAPGASGRGGRGSFVYPAFKGDAACSGVRAPMGARFYLPLTPAQVAATGAPLWEQAEANAVHQYGAIVSDTGGPGFGFMLKPDLQWTALGQPNPYLPLATKYGLKKDSTYGYPLRPSGKIPWDKMQVVAPQ